MSKENPIQENQLLKKRIKQLEKEVLYLRTHPAIVQGMRGETIVCKLTDGVRTSYADEIDIVVKSEIKIEVKFSKLNTPDKGAATKRWNWSKPLGWKDKGKDFDFLFLLGEKDPRFEDQYLDNSPYVYFLMPSARLDQVMTSGTTIGSNIQINTNLRTAKSPASMALKKFMVSDQEIHDLLNEHK